MPPQYTQQPSLEQQTTLPSQQGVPPQMSQLPPRRSSAARKVLLIVGVLFLVSLLSGAGFWLYSKTQSTPPKAKIDDSILTKLQNPSLTTASLGDVKKEDAFYAYLKHAAQEQKMTITKSFYYSDNGTSLSDNTFSKVGVDYQTKEIVYAYEKADGNNGRSRYRCYDGQEYTYFYEWTEEDTPTICGQDRLYSNTTDGFNAGGLTPDQAETFVSYLRDMPGLITVGSMKLDDHADKQYVHFSAKLQQINVNNTQFAAQWLMFAFKKTGLDPTAHPYGYIGSGGQGFTLDYYVDPVTSLPVYSEIMSLPRVDDANKNDKGSYHYRVQYDFTSGTFEAGITNNTNIEITW